MVDMTSRDELIAQIAERLREVAQVMRDSTTQEWLQLDLSMAQLKALFVLAAAAPVTIGALAQALGIQLPAASHVADRLVQLGLAERYEDPADRRRTFVRLTAQASVLVERLRQGKRAAPGPARIRRGSRRARRTACGPAGAH
jgi:DNA-binding MarR family transcriptional regulator